MARVLHVLKHFRPAFTGEGIFIERVTPVMDVLRTDVAHDMLATETPDPGPIMPACSTLRRITYLTRTASSYFTREVRTLWWLLGNLRRYRVVHFHTHADRYFLSYMLVKMMGRRLILSATLDDSVPGLLRTYRPATRWIAARLFRLFDAFVAISSRLQEENLTVVPPERTHMIPIGIQIPERPGGLRAETRARLGVSNEDMVLIFVGGICDRKDPLFLVEHLDALRASHPAIRLLLIGPVLEEDHLRRIRNVIAARDLAANVIFVGEVMDPYPYFAAADIMVFASHLEGFGTVVIEAMAHSLPVVVRDLPGVNDMFVIQGSTGFRFRRADEYGATMARLLGDAALRQKVGETARRFVTMRYDQIDVAGRYLEIYFPAAPLGTTSADDAPKTERPPPLIRTLSSLPASVSIIDGRFRTAARLAGTTPPLLITSIDAEEEFDWTQPFSSSSVGVSSMAEQYKAHRIFARHGVVPAYLLDYPVASKPEAYAPLRDYLRDGLCEVGTQLHPWVNPPFQETINRVNSFPGNLSLDLEFEKLRILTETIEANLGIRPRVYRAGRYGVGRRTGDLLKRLDYHVDTSVVPQRDFRNEGGPDFFGFPAQPFWMDDEKKLLELPVSSDFVGPLSPHSVTLARFMFGRVAERTGLTGTLAYTGMAERIKLTPEGITIDEACKLVRAMLARGTRVFTLSYHSPSLLPGSTPYVRDAEDLARFLDWLDAFYTFFREEVGGLPVTYAELYRLATVATHGAAMARPAVLVTS